MLNINGYVTAAIAALPFALLQLVFLTDPYGYSVALFGYGAIGVAAFGCIVGWLAYLLTESYLRRRSFTSNFCPSFALTGGIFLLMFFAPAMILRPVLRNFPSLCRATQAVRWETTRGQFILVMTGTGTAKDYRFFSGYMNWNGNGRAGFSSIHVDPIEFQYDYYGRYRRGSVETLRERLGRSGLPDSELDPIVADVWSVLELAEKGTALTAQLGTVGDLWSDIDGMVDAKLGGLIWLALLLSSFVIVSHYTIPRFNTGQTASTEAA